MFRIYESNNYPRDIIGTWFFWVLSPAMEPTKLFVLFCDKKVDLMPFVLKVDLMPFVKEIIRMLN